MLADRTIVLSDTNCNHGSDIGHASFMVKTILPNWDGGYWNKSYHRRKNCEGGLKGSAVYESCLSFRENKNGRRLQKVAENGVELKPIVFALFSQNEKSATWISSKLLIFSVDQPGLEPGTSRL